MYIYICMYLLVGIDKYIYICVYIYVYIYIYIIAFVLLYAMIYDRDRSWIKKVPLPCRPGIRREGPTWGSPQILRPGMDDAAKKWQNTSIDFSENGYVCQWPFQIPKLEVLTIRAM